MMLVVALCLMMQLVQFSAAIWPPQKPKPVSMAVRKSRKYRSVGKSKKLGGVMSAEHTAPAVAHTDFNSNQAAGAEFTQSATASENDFVHDNSEYQWFLDYGRDGGSTQHTSVLSSCLGDSLGGRYEALARRLDANLAHVDMETFRSEDIHSLLAALPALTGSGSDLQSERPAGEMYASVTGSLMTKFDLDSSSSPHTSSQDSAESAMSICKSEPLFSPVKECAPLPVASNFSVDSLDCELLLTCRHANKDNYTIAFEAESDADPEDSISAWTDSPQYGVSMARSDSVYTTWSKLSGNNNHSTAAAAAAAAAEASLRSHSLPDLAHPRSSTGSEQRLSLVKLFMRRNEDEDDDDEDSSESVIPLTESVSSLNNNHGNIGQSQGTQTHSATRESSTQHTNDLACRSVQTSLTEEKVRPVYVCYPNYALPNLDFLQNDTEISLENNKGEILLAPQRFRPASSAAPIKKPRPFSCNDVEALRRKGGFAHVRDWPSLTFLLPREYQQVLTEIPETPRPLFSVSKSPKGCHCTSLGSSSSGYRGSSDMLLTESHQTPPPPPPPPPPQDPLMFVYRYDSASSDGSTFSTTRAAPPAPPPRGILRKDSCTLKRQSDKRQLGQHIPLSKLMGEMTSEEMDEGVDAGTDSSFDEGGALTNPNAPRPPTPPIPRPSSSTDSLGACLDALVPEASALLARLIASQDENESWDDQHMARLRAQVSRFLSGGGQLLSPINPPNTLNANTSSTPGSSCDCSRSHSKKSVKFSEHVCVHLRCGGGQNGTDETIVLTPPNSPSTQMPPPMQTCAPTVNLADLEQKRGLVTAVCDSIDRLVTFYAAEPDLDTTDLEVARLSLTTLCPALYSALSDGLRPEIATAFGPVPNSLWQVVEASSQAGSPLTRSLSELTLRINGEPALSDAPLKFNAFVFGLLNAGSFHAWLGYLRARESVLRKHYTAESLMTSPATRSLVDRLVASLRPLAGLPFNLDLLHECRELHASLRRIDSVWQKERPRSCLAAPNTTPSMTAVSSSLGESLADLASTVKKRWSGIQLGSKLFQAFDRLAAEDSDEEYTDSLENPRRGKGGKGMNINNSSTPPAPNTSDTEESEPTLTSQRGPDVTGRFRRLQRKWELLSGISTEDKTPSPTSTNSSVSTTTRGSKIPRPVAPTGSSQVKRTPRPINRPETANHTAAKRPSSLPYRAAPTSAGPRRANSNHSTNTPRRAASSSLGRRGNTEPPKFVRTVCHRLPMDNGHLSFNEGEKLRLVLEVDAKWLLCCRGDSKGLVPRSAVVSIGDRQSLERRPNESFCA